MRKRDEGEKAEATRVLPRPGPIPAELFTPDAAYREDLVSLLIFEVGGDGFAVAVEQTEGVVDCPPVAPLPSPPDRILGVASVRGRMTLVADLSLRAQRGGRQRLVLLKGEAQLGLLADRVEGVVRLEPKELRPARDDSKRLTEGLGVASAWLSRDGREIAVVDVERLAEL